MFEGRDEAPRPRAAPTEGLLIDLDDERALRRGVVGAKAAGLARAHRAGLPVLPGTVVPVGTSLEAARPALRAAWSALGGETRGLAVRSSATVEDGTATSMAGRFLSVLDVRDWPGLCAAVEQVRASADGVPMAVLLQPMIDAEAGGVLFGVDPVTGRPDRLLVEVVRGGPARLVAGQEPGIRYLLRRGGSVVESDERRGARILDRSVRRTLAAAARTAAEALGRPQDIEWAVDRAGRFWLLQSRPVTAVAARTTPRGATFGPGPVAETFPDALAPLEIDLWVDPLRSGVRSALEVLGVLPGRAVARSEVVITVGGRVAADLDLFGERPRKGFVARFDPRPPARRLVAAWRVGRLRRAMPALAADVVARVDADLGAVVPPAGLGDRALLDLLRAARRELHAVHGHEVLAGALGAVEGASGAAHALAFLAAGRRAGLGDGAIVSAHPEVLALTAPVIGLLPVLPDLDPAATFEPPDSALSPREALRLRARWLHELTARVAAELGWRLHERGSLAAPELVRGLSLEELDTAVTRGEVPAALGSRPLIEAVPPLPAAFRLAADGTVVACGSSGDGAGRGAGGGRGAGPVHHLGSGPPPPGSVLVVDTLDPVLAAVLPQLVGIIAETGSVLSHLAILARELGVPAVVGVAGARTRFPEGSSVVVDGATGEVVPLERDATGEARR